MEILARACTRALGGEKRKERFDTILEPFQAMTQLAMLSFCPVGTKLSISNNVLFLQPPGWTQSVARTYYQDQRDDLFYLFKVIARYHKFYGFLGKDGGHRPALFVLLKELSKKGLDNITQTYALTDQTALLHTLRMYRTMLDKPDLLEEAEPQPPRCSSTEENDIDGVFIHVRRLYKPEHYEAIYNLLTLAQADPQSHEPYLGAIEALLTPSAKQIKKWISDNIVF
jgi:hypothetical protein